MQTDLSPVARTMDWEIRIDEAAKYIEIVTQGIADKHGSMEMAKKIAETMRHLRFTKAIIDHRNITTVSGTIMDVYERPKLFRGSPGFLVARIEGVSAGWKDETKQGRDGGCTLWETLGS